MHRLLLLSAALGLGLAGPAAYAQPSVGQTQNPPGPNSQNSDLGQSPNSLPRGGAPASTAAAGGALGGQATTPPATYSAQSASGVNTLHPLHPPRRRAVRHRVRRRTTTPADTSTQ